MKRILPLLAFSIFGLSSLKAQIEVTHISSKGFSATGFGGFLNFATPVSEGAAVTGEFGVYYLKNSDDDMALVPIILGYRYMMDGSESGLYVEPTAGYTIGATDIQKYSASGDALYKNNGDPMTRKAQGVTGGIATGYIFPGRISFNIGLRYQHIFVAGDPSLNMFSLRVSHTLVFGRRNSDYY